MNKKINQGYSWLISWISNDIVTVSWVIDGQLHWFYVLIWRYNMNILYKVTVSYPDEPNMGYTIHALNYNQLFKRFPDLAPAMNRPDAYKLVLMTLEPSKIVIEQYVG